MNTVECCTFADVVGNNPHIKAIFTSDVLSDTADICVIFACCISGRSGISSVFLTTKTYLVNPTTVRVPVIYGHSEAVHIKTKKKITADKARELLKKAKGVSVIDEQKNGGYATPATDAAGKDDTYVSRIREDITRENGLNMWIVSDNIRKGAALNSIQIAEILIKDFLQ